jgi:hypothetical protein
MAEQLAHVCQLQQATAETSAALRTRAGDLIRHYVQTRSTDAAAAVADVLERLYWHPDFAQESRNRCELQRLRAHWLMLAFVSRRA